MISRRINPTKLGTGCQVNKTVALPVQTVNNKSCGLIVVEWRHLFIRLEICMHYSCCKKLSLGVKNKQPGDEIAETPNKKTTLLKVVVCIYVNSCCRITNCPCALLLSAPGLLHGVCSSLYRTSQTS